MAPINLNLTGGGTTIYLYNSNGSPTVDGAATSITTTPFMLYNDGWTTTAAPMDMAYSGGPPFHNGSRPVYRSYANVQETFTVELYCSTHNTAVARIQQLSQILNTSLFSTPCVLAITPSGASNTMYAEIYQATVQPLAQFNNLVNPVAGWTTIGVQISITRSPFFGAASLATLINAATFNNTGTGANNNTQSLGALTGDLIYEGQPLNIKLTPSAANGSYVLATVLSRTYGASVAAAGTTSSTSYVAYTSGVSLAIPTIRDNAGVRVRVHIRVKTLTNPTKAQLRCTLVNGSSIVTTMPIQPILGSDTTGQFVDFGGVPLDAVRNSVVGGGSAISVSIDQRSTDGSSTTVQLDYSEILLYYDYMLVNAPTTNMAFWVASAQNLTGNVWLPMASGVAVNVDGSNLQLGFCDARGTYPRAFSGASLYMAMYNTTTKAHVIAHTATITVNHAPLYRVFRGNG